jgi:uncharacterized membrane protein HdeD (DUF308 family)
MHTSHELLVLSTAILLIGSGIAVLALGWRRAFRGESSGMVIGTLSARASVMSLVAVPVVGALGLLVVAAVAAALR